LGVGADVPKRAALDDAPLPFLVTMVDARRPYSPPLDRQRMSAVNLPSNGADSCRRSLEREGWTIEETAITDKAGRSTWIATAEKHENRLRSEAATRNGAWWGVWFQAFMGWTP
jgi:hypothetical protein